MEKAEKVIFYAFVLLDMEMQSDLTSLMEMQLDLTSLVEMQSDLTSSKF